MRTTATPQFIWILVVSILAGFAPPSRAQEPAKVRSAPCGFHVTFAEGTQTTPFTGRVYVVVADLRHREPRRRVNNWLEPHYLYAVDVKDHDPNQPIVFDDKATCFPRPISALAAQQYQFQAIARRNPDAPTPGRGPGDLYSIAVNRKFDPGAGGYLQLELSQVVKTPKFEETDRVKSAEVDSPLLTEFLGRPRKLHAGVVLPKGWTAEGTTRYPVLYIIPMHGIDHRIAGLWAQQLAQDSAGQQIMIVVIDATCHRGHSMLVDSANNGPWATAIMTELIPAVEAKYRGDGSGAHRYLLGMSTGGYSALWLQTQYPDSFNGCWAHAPETVDFRALYQTDIYADSANLYTDEQGERRPIYRTGGGVMFFEDAAQYEVALGPGGRIHTLEAAFSPKGPDGAPLPLFERLTGRVFPDVAKAWRAFDLRLILERRWAKLGPKLSGKLHIYAGSLDNFYLNIPTEKLRAALEGVHADAEVRIVEGMGHDIAYDTLEPMYETIAKNYGLTLLPKAKPSENVQTPPAQPKPAP